MHGFEWTFLKGSVGMENRKDCCCCKGCSAGSRAKVCVSLFLGTEYIINCYEEDSKYLNEVKYLEYKKIRKFCSAFCVVWLFWGGGFVGVFFFFGQTFLVDCLPQGRI